MKRSYSQAAVALHVGIALTFPAFAQSLVEPEREASIRRLFETAASAPQLRCSISSARPALNFDFRQPPIYLTRTEFAFEGDTTLAGPTLFEYWFRVPRERIRLGVENSRTRGLALDAGGPR